MMCGEMGIVNRECKRDNLVTKGGDQCVLI